MMASETGDLRFFPTVLDGVWRVFSDLRTTLALVMLVAALLILQMLVPAASIGPGGLFLRFSLALLAFSLALRLAAHIAQAAGFRQGRAAPAPAVAPATLELAGPVEAVRAHAEGVVRAAYELVLATPSEQGVYGARRRAGIIGPILAAGGPLVLMLGLLVNTLLGWSAPGIIVTQGGASALNGVRLALTGEGETPHVVVDRPGAAPVTVRVGPGRPAATGSMWVFEQERGPTLEAAAQDAAGQPLALAALETGAGSQTELSLAFPATQTEQAFSAPAQGLVFRAVSYASLPERGIAWPVFLVEAYREGETTPALSELVEDEATLALDGASYTLRRGSYLTALAADWPGWPLAALGGLLTAAGLLIALLWGPQEAWVDLRARGRETAVAVRTSGGLRPGKDAKVLAVALNSAATEVATTKTSQNREGV